MPSRFTEAMPRSFNPMSVPGLPQEGREAVNAALKAMSAWRNETAENNEKNSRKVIEKMAAAAAALGWPQQVVDAARAQMQTITDMQIKTMDHMMDAWEDQLRLPNPMTASPSTMLSKLKSLPGLGTTSPDLDTFQKVAMHPLQLWMQVAEQWQKSWTDTMTFWSNAGKPH